MTLLSIIILSVAVVLFLITLSAAIVFGRFAVISIRAMPEETLKELIQKYDGKSLHFFLTK